MDYEFIKQARSKKLVVQYFELNFYNINRFNDFLIGKQERIWYVIKACSFRFYFLYM